MITPFAIRWLRGMPHWLASCLAGLWILACPVKAPAASPPAAADPADEAAGRALAAQLRSLMPAKDLLTSGRLLVRSPEGTIRAVPVRMRIEVQSDSATTSYEAFSSSGDRTGYLAISQAADGSRAYFAAKPEAASEPPARHPLLDPMIPFAGSDFWAADLGLEFLSWPLQRIVRSEMRRGRPCRVLESQNPSAPPSGYSRVLSWIDAEQDQIILAKAYTADRKLLKEFSIDSLKKVHGRWQVKKLEMRNLQSDTRTQLEFDLDVPAE